MLTYQGIVQNGVIVIENGAVLPEGLKVSVAVAPVSSTTDGGIESEPTPEEETIGQKMVRIAKKHANRQTDLPTDLAENHDHYIHGTPKQS